MPRILSPSDIVAFRDRVSSVAAVLLAEMGYDNFTMRDLAKRLGSSAMTPYRYFANKDAILALVRVKGFSLLADRLECVLRDDGTAAEKSHAFVACYVTFVREENAFYQLMFGPALASSASEPDREEQRVRSLFAEYAKLQSGRMGSDIDADRMGELLWSTLHGAVVFQRLGRIGSRDFEYLVDNVLASVAAADLPATALAESALLLPHAGNGARDWAGEVVSTERASPPLM
jgi:AcrR family transcriptional regulator